MAAQDPFPVHSLALEALKRDQDRIDARRQRNEARAKRFNDLGKKTKGVDVATLDLQVASNALKKDQEKVLDAQYASMVEQVSLVVEERRLAEDEARKAALRELTADWDVHSKLPKNEHPKLAPGTDLSKAGLAAAQSFLGDDPEAPRRKLRQNAQMRAWTLEQAAMKEAKKHRSREEDRRFAAWEAQVSKERGVVEAMQKEMARKTAQDLRAARDVQVAERYQRELEDREAETKADAAEVDKNLADPMLNEAMFLHPDGRIRVDHFKGYTKGQTTQIYAENEAVQKYRAAHRKGAHDDDARDNAEAERIQTLVSAAEYEASETRRQERLLLKEHLEVQRSAERARKVEGREAVFGAITEGGILSGFGQSYR